MTMINAERGTQNPERRVRYSIRETRSAPSPLAGEGRGEGFAPRVDLAIAISVSKAPLTLTLSLKGRGDRTGVTRALFVVANLLALFATPLVAIAQPPLLTVDRPIAAGRPTAFADGGTITFAVQPLDGDKPVSTTVAVDDLVSWGAPAEFGRGIYALLADGSVLYSETVAVADDSLDFLSPQFDSRTVPLAQARGIVLRPPASAAARDRLFRLPEAGGDGDRDRLLLVGGDDLLGTLTKLDSRHVVLETDVGPAQVELGRVTAVVFNPALAAKYDAAAPRTLVGLRDGSLLACSAITGTDRLQLTPRFNAAVDPKFNKPWQCDAEDVVFLQRFGGRAVYLSDREPSGYKHVPYFDLSRPYRADLNVNGRALRADGRRYLKGIGMTSTSRLTYPLDPAFKTFAAEIAIDDETDGRGSVTFRVFVDAEERFRSEIVRGGDAPQPITVDVAGGKTLSLVVDFAERADELDHADWLNARLLP
jgi:hypothetical protein